MTPTSNAPKSATVKSIDNPNVWIINRNTGEMRGTTYSELSPKYNVETVGENFHLPPSASSKHVLPQYPDEVRHAYLDAVRQLVQVSRARKSPIEQIHERHKRMGMDMKDYLHLLWEYKDDRDDEPWLGEPRLEATYGRSTTSTPEKTEQFKQEIAQFYEMLDQIGVNMCDISKEGSAHNIEKLEQFLEEKRLPYYKEAIENREWELRAKQAWIDKLGVIPEHIPFFDGDFYDMDIDSITTRPQYKLSAHAIHTPLTLSRCHQLNTEPVGSTTQQIISGSKPNSALMTPVSWEFGDSIQTDFSKIGYGSLYRPIKQHHYRYKKDLDRNISKTHRAVWRALSPAATYITSISQEELRNMDKQFNQDRRSTDDPQFERELNRMLGSETGDIPSKVKKGKGKKPKKDVFGAQVDFPGKKKKKKDDDKKKKKTKDKNNDDSRETTIDIGDAMDTSDAAKAITKSINSSKLKKILTKSIGEGRKTNGKKK